MAKTHKKLDLRDLSPDKKSAYGMRILLALVLLLGPLIIFQILQYTLLDLLIPLLPSYSNPFFNTFYYFLPFIGYEVIALVIIMCLIIFDRKNITFRDLHFNKPDVPKSNLWFLATFGFGFLVTSGFLIVWICFLFPIPRPVNNIYLFLFETCLYLILFLLVGISEEFYFRGYIQASAYKVYDRRFAPAFTSLLFAAIHIPKYVFAAIFNLDIFSIIQMFIGFHGVFVIGLWLAYIRDNLKVIWASVVAHMFWDFWLTVLGPDTKYISNLPLLQMGYLMIFGLTAPLAMYGTLILSWILSSRVLKVEDLEEANYGFNRQIKELMKKHAKISFKISKFQGLISQTSYPRTIAILSRSFRRLEARNDFIESVITLLQDLQEDLTNYNIPETHAIEKEQLRILREGYKAKLLRLKFGQTIDEAEFKKPSLKGMGYQKQEKEPKFIKCPFCGSVWSTESRFCAKCGNELL